MSEKNAAPETEEVVTGTTEIPAEDIPAAEAEAAEDKKKKKTGARKKSDSVTVKKKEWDKLNADCAEYLDAAKRIKAEFDNFRKRNETVRSDSYNDGVAQAVMTILPVLDNLERASETFAEADEGQKQGMELILRQMIDALEKLGVTEVPAAGEKFDPNLHQAVMQIEAGEGQESGDVAQVLMKGYRTQDKVLRYAMVAVVQ